MKLWNITIFLVLSIFSTCLPAKERIVFDNDEQLSLLISTALKNNKQVQSLLNKWESSKYKAIESKKLDFPTVTYSYYIDEVETRVGAQKNAVNVLQSFPFFGKLKTKFNTYNALSSAEEFEYYAGRDKIIFEVKDAYYEYMYIMKSIDITREHIDLLTSFERLINIKYKTNKAMYQDLLRVQIELDKLKDKLLTLQSYKKLIISRFITAVGTKEVEDIVEKIELNYPDVVYEIPSKEELMKELFETNPILKKQNAYVNAQKSKVKLAKLNYFPDYALGVTYINTEDRDLNMIDNGKDPIIVMLKLKLPIWFRKLNANLKEEKYNLLSKQEIYKDTEYKLEGQLELIYYKLDDSKRKIELYRDSLLPKAESSLKTIHINYKAARSDFLDLIEAERLLLTLKLDYFRSVTTYYQKWAALEKLIGKILE